MNILLAMHSMNVYTYKVHSVVANHKMIVHVAVDNEERSTDARIMV